MEVVVQLAFVDKLRMIGVGGLDFDSHFEIGFGVDGLVDLPESTLVDFADNFEVLAYLL